MTRSIGRLHSSSQIHVDNAEEPETEQGKGQNRTPRASTDVSRNGSPRRKVHPFASTATSISAASSPIAVRHADNNSVKQPDESVSSPRSIWKLPSIMKNFLSMTRGGRSKKPNIVSASANPISTHSHTQTHHDLDLTQLEDNYSTSYPGGIDFSRRAKSVNEVNSVTEGEGEEDVLLITYDTEDEEFSDFDDPNPTRFLGAGGYGTPLPNHMPLETERVGRSLISLLNGGPSGTLASSGEVLSPIRSPGDGSEPVRVFGRYFQHTTGTPGETSRDSYDDSTTHESPISPHSPTHWDGPQRQRGQRPMDRTRRQKFTTEDDADSDSDPLEMPLKHKSRFG